MWTTETNVYLIGLIRVKIFYHRNIYPWSYLHITTQVYMSEIRLRGPVELPG